MRLLQAFQHQRQRETLSPGVFVRHGAFSFISAVCVAHVKGLVYISAVVSCLRRWNSSCFADRDKHDKKSSCRTHLEARDSRGRSCAPSPAPLGGTPAGLWGEGWGHPAGRERGVAPLVSGFTTCARSERGPRSEEEKGREQGEGIGAGEGAAGGRDPRFLHPVVVSGTPGHLGCELVLQQSLFRAGKKGGYVNIQVREEEGSCPHFGKEKGGGSFHWNGSDPSECKMPARGEIKKKKRIKSVRFRGVCWGLLLSFLSHSLKPHSAFPSNSSILSFPLL